MKIRGIQEERDSPERDKIMNVFMLEYDPDSKLLLEDMIEKAGVQRTQQLINELSNANG